VDILRRELISNIEGFDESNLKKLINLKPQNVNPLDNPKYVQLQDLINKIGLTNFNYFFTNKFIIINYS
jgi:hypothetical protein